MYKKDVPSREGKFPRYAGKGQFRGWEREFLERVKASGEYLTLYARLSINPEEWGQSPVRQTGNEITANFTVGRNETGHRLGKSTKH